MYPSMKNASLVLAMALMAMLTGCATPQGENPQSKRNDVMHMRQQALETLYAKMPEMRDQVAQAPGYGAFSGISTQTIFLSSGNGFGVIHDNQSGKDTYMRALKLGGGLGVGLQDVQAIVVFHDRKTMEDMIKNGWAVSGRAEAAAKMNERGGSEAMVITLPGMSIYRFTENGVMLGGAMEGTKVWPDDELNQ